MTSRSKIHLLLLLGLGCASESFAGPREQAIRMYNRVAGIPPSEAEIGEMIKLIKAGDLEGAALRATKDPAFYNIMLPTMITPWTNEDGNVHVELNDYSATVIGMIRDDVPFNEVLSGDHLYVVEASRTTLTDEQLPPYNPKNNDHYKAIRTFNLDLSKVLEHKSQIEFYPEFDNQANYLPAGVYTTRGFAEAYFIAGTNRAAFKFTLKTFFCSEIDAFHDVNIPDAYIRQDVDRKPGGDSSEFLNKCKGCHAGMDAMSGAFAYIEFDDNAKQLKYTRPMSGSTSKAFEQAVVKKYFNNAGVFPKGRRTKNDYWLNLWASGQNERIGWNMKDKDKLEGFGIRSFGKMISEANTFKTCMAKRVYSQVCMREADAKTIDELSQSFGGALKYRMRDLFAHAAARCSED